MRYSPGNGARPSLRPTAGVLAGTVLALATGVLHSADAYADVTYFAVAEATGTRVITTNESIPLGIAPQLQGPTASARQNSLQQSDASAAFPYPGEDVAGLPGIAAGAGVPAPPYPFVVSSALGDPVRQASFPGVELRAESADALTQATATGGSKDAGTTSVATIVRDGQGIVARATTDADTLLLGHSLVLSGLHAAATASRDSVGRLKRTSALSFSSLSGPGFVIGLIDGKFSVRNGAGAPTESDSPLGLVAAALSMNGFPTTFQDAQETPDGIVGDGLQITVTLPAPPPGSAGSISGETPVTYSLGLLSAEVAYQAAPPAPVGATPSGVATAPDVATASAGESPTAQAPMGRWGTTAARETAAAVPTVSLARGTSTIDLAAHQTPRPQAGADVGWMYLVVAAVGAAAFAGCGVLRYRSVR